LFLLRAGFFALWLRKVLEGVEQGRRVDLELIQQRLQGLSVDVFQQEFFTPSRIGPELVQDFPALAGELHERQPRIARIVAFLDQLRGLQRSQRPADPGLIQERTATDLVHGERHAVLEDVEYPKISRP
jgi:hypothetical protein